MVPASVRIAQSLSRSWCGAVDSVSRSAAAGRPSSSYLVLPNRGYSTDPGLHDSAVPSQDGSASSASDPADPTALPSTGVPVTGVDAGSRKQGDRTNYPPRNYRTPRGVYKAIVLGEVGQPPIQKILKSGRCVTIFSVGTGGMYNNRRPFEGESPEEFADRSYTQWHRVTVYQDRVGTLVMQHVKVGSQVYLEGNIESRVYNDPHTGIVKRIREIAVRANGRLMFMDANWRPANVPAQAATAPPVTAAATEAPSTS